MAAEDGCASRSTSANSVAATEKITDPPASIYFTLRDYLTAEELLTFFEWEHDAQVAKVAEYLDFVGRQPAAAHFTSSTRASTSWAELLCNDELEDCSVNAEVLQELLNGKARSGFGAFGSDASILPQKELSLQVAQSVKAIGHEYVVQKPKRGPLVLNSRSFHTTWCHAEKQKVMDIKQKLDRFIGEFSQRVAYWKKIVVVVDRSVCADCVQYFRCFAAAEGAEIFVRDPTRLLVFPPNKEQHVSESSVDDTIAARHNSSD